MKKIDVIDDAVKKILEINDNKFETVLNGWYGWEKWFQVELASILKLTGDVYIEDRFSFNKNKKRTERRAKNSNGFVDIAYRHADNLRDKYVAIEIKIKNLKGVIADLKKIRAIKNSEWTWRAVFCIYICKSDGCGGKYSKTIERIRDTFEVKEQKAGMFDIFIFGWEPKTDETKYMTYYEYNDWLSGLTKIFEEEGVNVPAKRHKLIKQIQKDANGNVAISNKQIDGEQQT